MEKVEIRFEGDDAEQAKELFFDWWEPPVKLENFEDYLASWDVHVKRIEAVGNIITVRT